MLMQIAHQSCSWILHTQPILQSPVQHRLTCFNGAARRNQYRTAVRARKKAEVAEEWASLARDDQLSDEDDPELQRSINEVCNKGLRYMLRGEKNRLMDYRDELSRFGQYFSDRNNVAGKCLVCWKTAGGN
ncbi:hypothetical protein COCOBI_08-2210 [Coccomyxa sp. Obi]|nr:hypothetical protein COCOBI_08-2210 [Coccomyxa sp. Obi]